MRAPNIFDYQDYRAFLKDLIAYRKSNKKNYSRKTFATAIGFASDAGLNMVLSGKRSLRSPYLEKCLSNIRFALNEKMYFESLVKCDSLSDSQKRKVIKEAKLFKDVWEPPSPSSEIRLIDYSMVHQILSLNPRFLTAKEVKHCFRYEIPIKMIERILNWMAERQYVTQLNDRYRLETQIMKTVDEVPNENIQQVHIDALKLAEQALKSDPIESREFQTYFFTINKERLPELKSKVKETVISVISEFNTEEEASTSVQMHFNLFETLKGSKI